MRFAVKIDGADQASDAFREVRRGMNRGVRDDLKSAVESEGLPTARRLAPGRIGRIVRAGATSSTAFLEVPRRKIFPGRKGAEVPRMLHFGGTRRDVIRAKGYALRTPYGPRRAVTGPRTYKPNPYLYRAVDLTRGRVLAQAERLLGRRFEKAGL